MPCFKKNRYELVCLDNDEPERAAAEAPKDCLDTYEAIDNSPYERKDYNDPLKEMKGIDRRIKTRSGEAR